MTARVVAQVVPGFYPYASGASSQILQMSRRLHPFDYVSRVLTTLVGAHGSPEREVYEGVDTTRLKVSLQISRYFYTPGLTRELGRCNPDLVHAHGYRTYQTQAAFGYAKRTKIPFVLSLHGSGFGYDTMVTSRMGKLPFLFYDRIGGLRQVSGADAIVVNTIAEGKEVTSHLGADKNKVHVIPAGIESNPVSEGSPNGHNLLFVARVAPQRDPAVLVRAMSALLPEFPDAKLTIVGGDVSLSGARVRSVTGETESLAKKLRLGDAVRLTGELHGNALREEFLRSDIFVYNSVYESFGQAILEAASYGIPIVSTTVGVAQDLLSEGDGGVLVPSTNNFDQFVTAMRLLLANPELRMRWGRSLRSKVTQEYAWDGVVAKYASLYGSLISKN